MLERTANAKWTGDLKGGKGNLALGSGKFEGQYSFKSRFAGGEGTNPEELIGAANAGCFSMMLSLLLGEEGYKPENIETEASVFLDEEKEAPEIARIALETTASVPDIEEDEFEKIAEEAKEACPVSKALAVSISLDAKLV